MVPVTVDVESPMTEQDYVKAVMCLPDGNPLPGIVSYRFTPARGKASASTRMRLAQTQNIICIAEMSNGNLHMAKSVVKVTDRRLRRLTGSGSDSNRQARKPHMSLHRPRVRLPAQAKVGEMIEIKTLISHEMESGQRAMLPEKSSRARSSTKFTAAFNGKTVFEADWIRPSPPIHTSRFFAYRSKPVNSRSPGKTTTAPTMSQKTS